MCAGLIKVTLVPDSMYNKFEPARNIFTFHNHINYAFILITEKLMSFSEISTIFYRLETTFRHAHKKFENKCVAPVFGILPFDNQNLCIKEVVPILYSKLLYKRGHYFLDK